MKRFLIGLLMVAGMLVGSLSVQAAPDFSGTWVLDLDKSDLGVKNMSADKQAQMKKVTIVIKQTASQLTIQLSTGDTAAYNLDGSPSSNALPDGTKATTVTKWDGDTLVSTTTYDIGGQSVETHDVRSLDASGKIMTLQITRQMPSGEVKRSLTYNKQD